MSSSEIVVADPIICPDNTDYAVAASSCTQFHDAAAADNDTAPPPFDSERLPPTLSREIQRFLRIANWIQDQEPRIAYLCRFQAFEIAHNIDHNSSGRGVRQFKTSLLRRLEHDEETTLRKRKEKSDIRELRRVYQAYKNYIIRSGGGPDLDDSQRDMLVKARRIASVLYEVLKTVTDAAGHQALAERDAHRARSDLYVPYNIIPLDHGGIQDAIMQFPEIKAAVAAIRNVRGLPPVEDFHKCEPLIDLFEFLQCCFGFQEGNVANQREHLILLLANSHIRQSHKQTSIAKLGDAAVDELMKKIFKNYTSWCKFLRRPNNIRLPYVKQEAQQYKILYMGLYLLIWGEAANLRFMPECICYIFHHMAYEIHGALTQAVSFTSGEKVMPAYGGGFESFLKNVVTPIYNVIYEEAKKNKSGMADHSTWRNYDDLNEYFWSPDCFQIGWPMRLNHDFFCVKPPAKNKDNRTKDEKRNREENNDEEIGLNEEDEKGDSVENREPRWLGKTNFVEVRSFWQIFRSFDRMWSFFILSLQAMIIIACHDLRSPLDIVDAIVFEDIMSIFITSAILKLIQAILEIVFTWKARLTMDISRKRKQMLKLAFATIWTIVLPVYYANSRRKYTCYSKRYGSWLGQLCFSSYMVAVAIYLTTNAIEMVLFFVPLVSKYIEISNNRICRALSWWTRVRFLRRCLQKFVFRLKQYFLSAISKSMDVMMAWIF